MCRRCLVTCSRRCIQHCLQALFALSNTARRELHWLPVQYRITSKLCLLMHLIHARRAPSHLTDTVIVTPTAAVNARARLQLINRLHYEKPRTRLHFGHQAFSYAAPAACNTLPLHFQWMTNIDTFERHLKGHQFQLACPWTI